MKKNIIIYVIAIILLASNVFCISETYAATQKQNEKVITNETESTLVELKEKEMKSLEDYQETYGSKSYGFTAYMLHKVQIFSIPLCFLGIMAGAIYNYVLGIRHLELQEKGLALMVTFVTLAIICQVLPLIFTIVVKFRRE